MILPREKSIYLCRDSGKVAKGEGIYQPDADHESREGHLARCNNQHFKNEVRLFRNLCNPVSGQKESTQASCYCGHQDTEPGRYIVNSLQYIKSQCRFKKYVPSLFMFSISSLALIYVLPDPIQQWASNHPRSKVDRSIHSYSQSVIASLAIWARVTSNNWDQLIILVPCEGQVLPVGKEATANHEEKEPEEILPFTWRSPNPKNNLVLLCICS